MRTYTKYLILLLTLVVSQTFAQEPEEKKIKIEASGFILGHVYYDSRQNVEALEGLLHIFPKDVNYDENGKDINEKSSLGIVDISSRIRGNVSGPDVFGAKLTGLLEIDFTGITGGFSTSRVRLRHAYSKLNWEKTEILFGREWHPMFVKEVYPSVMSLNTGIPFQPFNRSPMLQLSHEFGQFKIIGAAISQSDYVNSGPDGKSAQYLKNSSIPNLHLQLQFKPGNFLFGVAGDYKSIIPRLSTESLLINDLTYVTDEKLNSYAFMGYFKYQKPKFVVMGKAIYGQNLSESVMPGGYGVSVLDSLTGFEKYTPFNHFYTWANIVYGDKTKFGLFGGYTKNLGADDIIVGDTYGLALDIDYFYRITPTISHKIKNFMVALELEYSVATYGDDVDNYGKFVTSHEVSNTRVLFSVFHFF
ncbi:MAG: hypothetical protein PF485_11260 [Bacteroidales bacterium]|jgi:hypothetical protein|nr:hypothetical protein [Bacteroidales bacterium]